MTEFPALVYKAKGRFQRNGGTYDFTGVNNAEDLAKKLADGWFETLEAAINGKPVQSFAATELGIKFDGRYSDKRIAGLIEEALK